jgi:hypothetical protein
MHIEYGDIRGSSRGAAGEIGWLRSKTRPSPARSANADGTFPATALKLPTRVETGDG